MDKQIVVYKVSDRSEQKMGGRPIAIYNLDVVISVGYRVKSFQGTRFRQWATTNRRPSRMGGHENGIIRNEKREKDAGRQEKLERRVPFSDTNSLINIYSKSYTEGSDPF